MSRCRVVICLFLLVVCDLHAQQMSTKYYEENPSDEFFSFDVDMDPIDNFYLYQLYRNGSLFENRTRYITSSVDYSYRGIEPRNERYFFNALDLSPVFDSYADYSVISALRRMQPGYDRLIMGTVSPHATIMNSAVEYFSVRASDVRDGYRLRTQYADRNYRGAMSLSGAGEWGSFLRYAFNVGVKGGRDRFVDGVFSEGYHAAFDLEYTMASGDRLSFFALAAPSMHSTRTWAMQETFDLTGDNLYNPSWGWQDGRQRSSKIRRSATPIVALTYDFGVNERTVITSSLMWSWGEKSRSGLTWLDASSPIPDTYAYLPSYQIDSSLAESLADVWRGGDEQYTQINWRELYYQNLMNPTWQSVYVVDERVEQINNLQFSLMGVTRRGDVLESSYGLRYRTDGSHYFKRAADMLGGEWFYNIDQYLIGDVEYGDKYENDVLNPGRKVFEGEDFGYNYTMRRRALTMFGNVNYARSRLRLDLSGELNFSTLCRDGHYQKESLPSDSYGRSDELSFSSYAVKATAKYAFSINGSVAADVYAGEQEPLYDDVFISPQISNKTVAGREQLISVYGADMRLHRAFTFIEFDVAAYWNKHASPAEITRYYDDGYGEYCDMVLNDVVRRNSGVEMGVGLDLTGRLRLSLAYAYNSYQYMDNPRVDIYKDVDGEMLYTGGTAYMKGLISSSSPQEILSTGITYRMRDFRLNVDYAYMNKRYVMPSPLRRTERMLSYAASEESAVEWHEQEMLPSAGMLDLSLFRRFNVGEHSVMVSVVMKNVLNKKSVIYGGYEQMRFRKTTSDAGTQYRPYGSKYSYAYPRNCYLTLTYEF